MTHGRFRHSRAEVRSQLWRARRRALRWWRRMFDQDRAWWTDEQKHKWICRNARDRKRCSCWMCGNQRALLGPTLQEERLAASEAAEMDEIEGK